MATLTADYTHADVTAAFPTNGQAATVQRIQDTGANVKVMTRKYVAAGTIAADKNIIMFRVDEKIRILGGSLYCDGAVSTATADVGVIPISTMDDTNKAVLGAAIPIATAGAYDLVNGLASGTGVPGNMAYDVTVPSYIQIRTNTAGLAQDDVLKLQLFYVNI